LLDEPTTFLDIGHQLEALELVTRLNQERNVTTVMVLHDLNQAACYADRMIVLARSHRCQWCTQDRSDGRTPAHRLWY
jgi:iron complex transport system ATP-binding protein